MKDELKETIESYLLSATGTGWIKSSELCARFATNGGLPAELDLIKW